ncbi:hypothetical protein ACIQ9R_36285 [Streptomyces sp. NPDC094447]|uniref:zinc finger domain-containing protein n=1 Tax=Streptomyces sp. NPDC094447 TaxID=3366062 RepID=UPI00382CF205
MLDLSPRAELRVDTRDELGRWLHEYKEVPLAGFTPAGPYALYLTDDQQRYRWLLFDLDAKEGGVGLDLARLFRYLNEAGLSFVTASSGPGGGRHVWIAAAAPLPRRLVGLINAAAKKVLPSLDSSVLANPATGAVRPIGAPHRDGGHSTLISPDTEPEAARRLTPASCGNSIEAFERLAVLLGADPRETDVAPLVRRASVVHDRLGPRLAGSPSALLDTDTAAALRAVPDDASRALASLLVRLAVRRWTWPMVQALLRQQEYRRGGLMHACTRRRAGYRVQVSEEAAERRLARQWARCVEYASRMPAREDHADDAPWDERLHDIVVLVARLQTAADAVPNRWCIESGPADRAMLDLLCMYALKAGTLTLDLDIRRAALATGHGRSTMARATSRLALDGFIAARASAGNAGTWEVLPLLDEHPLASAAFDFPLNAWGGTQGPRQWIERTRTNLLEKLQQRLEHIRADLFSYGRLGHGRSRRPGGIGHHTGRLYAALAEHRTAPLTVADLAAATGYETRCVRRKLVRMQELMVVARASLVPHHECPTCKATPGSPCRASSGQALPKGERHEQRTALARTRATTGYWRPRERNCLVQAAQTIGVHGTVARRARFYAAESELWNWWRDEEEWMRSPKAGVRQGPRTHVDQGEIVLTTLGPWRQRRRYPRQEIVSADGRRRLGRADHKAAWERVLRRMPMA